MVYAACRVTQRDGFPKACRSVQGLQQVKCGEVCIVFSREFSVESALFFHPNFDAVTEHAWQRRGEAANGNSVGPTIVHSSDFSGQALSAGELLHPARVPLSVRAEYHHHSSSASQTAV